MNFPEGFELVVGLLIGGLVLIFLELFVPGVVLGIAGGCMLVAGCYYAFHLPVENPDLWGFGTVTFSAAAASAIGVFFFRSRYAKNMVLTAEIGSDAKAAPAAWQKLAGEEGTAHTDLRPSGVAEIAGKRVDVVAGCAFVARGSRIRVKQVDGSRVLVEPVENQST